MKNTPIFAIPVRPHVRQFMLYKYGPAQPHAVHQNTFLGRVVRMKIEKQPFRQLRQAEKPEGSVYQLTLPTALRHYTISPESAKQMGEMFDKLFQEALIMFVIGQVIATGNERKALRSFCKLYGIDPSDADLEVLRKVYRDYKEKVLEDNGQADLLNWPESQELFSDFAVRS
ncbi:hypothetical protein GO988_15990 [Hymenobacter sp. HMF4947]|uniref:Uncharacterized protein n=1 Tax=Hymenobacter ginkgonis TaxID=2682976 RepID=A0A7K1THJ3_9BACT|nr:hypothetical protein [Hymenobacter ginkgonis]MVN77833.1 hypothetical protein [Hymenobacter ginkgonis]